MAKEDVMTMKPGLKFSVGALDQAKEVLKALPAAPRETKEVGLREAIESLAPTIRTLLAKGYSRQQVVDLLQEQGVGCTIATLKTYFRRTSGKTKAKSTAASAATTTAAPTAADRETGSPAARLVDGGGSAGAGAGAGAAPRDATPVHAQSATGRSVGGEPAQGAPGTVAAGRTAAKAS
jgi:hypothetical protein